MAAVAVQPHSAPGVINAEHEQTAVRSDDGFHGDDEPLTVRLILVLQTQLGTNLCRTELQTELNCPIVDLLPAGVVRETEFGDGNVDQVNFHLLARHAECGLAEDVVRPVADAVTRLLDSRAEVIGRLDASTELHGLPDRELTDLLGRADDELGDLLAKRLAGENPTKMFVVSTKRENFVYDGLENLPARAHRLQELAFRSCHVAPLRFGILLIRRSANLELAFKELTVTYT